MTSSNSNTEMGPVEGAVKASGYSPVSVPHSEVGQEVSAEEAVCNLPASLPYDESDLCCIAGEALQPVSQSSDEEGHFLRAAKADQGSPSSPLIDALAELQVRRKFYIAVTNKQVNAAKALVRRALGDYSVDESGREAISKRAGIIVAAALAGKPQAPENESLANILAYDLAVIAAGLEPFKKARNGVELEMKKLSRKLPVAKWAEGVRGLGELGLAVIVGEAGDLVTYPKKGHLWKRFGLAPHEGKAYSTWRREGGLSADDWIEAGYSPRRRAEMYAVIAEPLFRQQTIITGPYRLAYDRRRAATAVAHPDWTKGHSHADALRVMTKYLLRDLWNAWRVK